METFVNVFLVIFTVVFGTMLINFGIKISKLYRDPEYDKKPNN